MNWQLSYQADPRACKLADRHYSRKKIGSPQFMPPGRQLVLLSENGDALWGTSWPREDCVDRVWFRDAWVCVMFRNESGILSSLLIREAVAITRWKYGNPGPSGMITMIDARKVGSVNPGYCYKQAGFRHVGYTQGGLHILQLLEDQMPEAEAPNGVLWEVGT
jgi:hypothetical protein